MNVVEWAHANWRLPGGEQIRLRLWQITLLLAIFPADGSPSPFETVLISTVKKAGKTTLNAIITLFAVLSFRAPEVAYVVANDEAQAQARVFDLIVVAVRAMGLERSGAARITRSEILFPETGSRIVAIPADFAGAAGAVFGVTSWTELWAFRYEGHIRLFEELTPIPNRRSLRIVDSYAGFAGDSPILEPMWKRALDGERIDEELPFYANGKLLAYIDQGEEAQQRGWLGDPADMPDYYAEQAATLRPGTFARLHENRPQSGDEAFVTAEAWDRCEDPTLRPVVLPDPTIRLMVGVDVATKNDCAAVVALTHEKVCLRLVSHRIWTPTRGQPLDLEETVERYLLELHQRHSVHRVRFDPYQFIRSADTLKKRGLRMEEFPQTSANLTEASQALYEIVHAGRLAVYPDAELRAHVLNAVAIESPRGWRLAKERSSRKIDAAVALSFAALGGLRMPKASASRARIRSGGYERDVFGNPYCPRRIGA